MINMKFKLKNVFLTGLGFLLMPYVVFAMGWLKLGYAIAIISIIAFICILIAKRIQSNNLLVELSLGGVLVLILSALLITWLSGAGGVSTVL